MAQQVLFCIAEGGSGSACRKALSSAACARVDVNMRERMTGESVLMKAARRGASDVVDVLLEKGALTELRDNEGRTALMLSALNAHAETVKVLVSKGRADVQARDARGKTALVLAAENGHAHCVEVLLQEDGVRDKKDGDGYAALEAAVREDHVPVAKVLLEHVRGPALGCDEQSQWLRYLAVVYGRKEMVSLLMAHGVDVSAPDVLGALPVDYAQRKGMRRWLEKMTDPGQRFPQLLPYHLIHIGRLCTHLLLHGLPNLLLEPRTHGQPRKLRSVPHGVRNTFKNVAVGAYEFLWSVWWDVYMAGLSFGTLIFSAVFFVYPAGMLGWKVMVLLFDVMTFGMLREKEESAVGDDEKEGLEAAELKRSEDDVREQICQSPDSLLESRTSTSTPAYGPACAEQTPVSATSACSHRSSAVRRARFAWLDPRSAVASGRITHNSDSSSSEGDTCSGNRTIDKRSSEDGGAGVGGCTVSSNSCSPRYDMAEEQRSVTDEPSPEDDEQEDVGEDRRSPNTIKYAMRMSLCGTSTRTTAPSSSAQGNVNVSPPVASSYANTAQ